MNSTKLQMLSRLSLRALYASVKSELEAQGYPEDIIEFALSFRDDPSSSKYVRWIAHKTKNDPSLLNKRNQLIDIAHWADHRRINLSGYSFEQAFDEQRKFYEQQSEQAKGSEYPTHNVVFRGNGYEIVKLTAEDAKIEGNKMSNCAGSHYALKMASGVVELYSLRDSNDEPHVSIVIENNALKEAKGKNNLAPKLEYGQIVKQWLDQSGFTIERGEDYVSLHSSDQLAGLAKHKDPVVRTNVASNKITPPNILAQLAKDEDWEVRAAVAMNRNTAANILVELAKDEDWKVRGVVAYNKNTPPNSLAELAKDENSVVRYHVAANTGTPPNILAKLAKDEDLSVRSAVAENESTAPNVLAELAKDEDPLICGAVASNKITPPNILAQLAKDEDWEVRAAVAMNRNTAANILVELAKDEYEEVRRSAGGNTGTPPNSLAELAKDQSWLVRNPVAANKNTPPNILAELAKDENWMVRLVVAHNKNTPPNSLEQLAKDESSRVRESALNTLEALKTTQAFLSSILTKLSNLAIAIERKGLYREAVKIKTAKRLILLQIFEGSPVWYDLDKEQAIIKPTDSINTEPPNNNNWFGRGFAGP